MTLVRYIGWVGQGSLGDDACFQTIQRLVKQRSHHAIEFDTALKSRAKGRADLVICGGGTLLAAWDNWDWTERLLAHVDQGVPVVLWGAGIHDPAFVWNSIEHTANGITQLSRLIDAATLIGLRTPACRGYLEGDGINVTECSVIGDPALSLEDLGDAVDLAQAEGFFPVGNEIGLCIGRAGGGMYGSEAEMVKQLVSLTSRLAEQEERVVLIPMADDDLKMVRDIWSELAHPAVHAFHKIYDGVSLMNFIAQLRGVVAQKLYGQVLAAAAGTPFVTLAYRPECTDFAQSVGQVAYTVRTDTPFVEGVLDRWALLQEEEQAASRRLVSQVSNQKAATGLFADKVINLLGVGIG